MTPLEYMNKMLTKQKKNLEKETERNAPKDVIRHINKKIGYYEAAVAALSAERCKDCKYYEINRPRVWEKENSNAEN